MIKLFFIISTILRSVPFDTVDMLQIQKTLHSRSSKQLSST